MLLLGHAGITLGTATIIAGTLHRFQSGHPSVKSWFAVLGQYIDIRILLIGSLLPDIIDKPLGLIFLRDSISYGRIYAHTLLFLILISLLGFLLFKRYRLTWLLVLAAGTLFHLLMDEMWQTPETLFWPLLGLSFPRLDASSWLPNIFEALLSYPSVYIPEIIGFISLAWFATRISTGEKLRLFLRKGYVS